MPFYMTTFLAWCSGLVLFAAALGVILKGVTFLIRLVRRVHEFLDDWNGEPAREGVEERPGVMKRLATLEARTKTTEDELTPNGGGSVKDAVKRIDKTVEQLYRERYMED